jgi:hypothetical protein
MNSPGVRSDMHSQHSAEEISSSMSALAHHDKRYALLMSIKNVNE